MITKEIIPITVLHPEALHLIQINNICKDRLKNYPDNFTIKTNGEYMRDFSMMIMHFEYAQARKLANMAEKMAGIELDLEPVSTTIKFIDNLAALVCSELN